MYQDQTHKFTNMILYTLSFVTLFIAMCTAYSWKHS